MSHRLRQTCSTDLRFRFSHIVVLPLTSTYGIILAYESSYYC
jgi:hypothetical protein